MWAGRDRVPSGSFRNRAHAARKVGNKQNMDRGDPQGIYRELAAIERGLLREDPELVAAFDGWHRAEHIAAGGLRSRRAGLGRQAVCLFLGMSVGWLVTFSLLFGRGLLVAAGAALVGGAAVAMLAKRRPAADDLRVRRVQWHATPTVLPHH